MNTIEIRGNSAHLPSNWSELSKRDLLFLGANFPLMPTHGFVNKLFWHFLNLKKNHKLAIAIFRNILLNRKLNRKLADHHQDDLFFQQILIAISEMDNFKWIFNDFYLEKCLLDSFYCGFTKFYGPDELLSNVTADEFAHAELFLLAFLEKQEIDFLDKLLATIWREASNTKLSHDKRIPFSEFEVDIRAKKLSKLSNKIKYAALLNYLGMRQAFVQMKDAKIVFEGTAKSNEQQNWSELLMRLSGSVFGTVSQTKQSFIHDIISHLAILKADSKK